MGYNEDGSTYCKICGNPGSHWCSGCWDEIEYEKENVKTSSQKIRGWLGTSFYVLYIFFVLFLVSSFVNYIERTFR